MNLIPLSAGLLLLAGCAAPSQGTRSLTNAVDPPSESLGTAKASTPSWNTGVTALIGKAYVDDDWDPTRDFTAFGFEFDAINETSTGGGVGFELGLRRGESKGDSFAVSHGGDGNTWRELFIGARYEHPLGFGRWLISGGLSDMEVAARQSTIFGSGSSDLGSTGFYARTGYIFPLGDRFHWVMEARYRGGSKANETGDDISLNQSSVSAGLSWRF